MNQTEYSSVEIEILSSGETRVHLKNHCSKPPRGLVWQVQRSLRWINSADLTGLGFILLVDEMPEFAKPEEEGATTKGFYVFSTSESAPHILLSIQDLYRGVPPSLWWSTVPTLLITWTLAHEVAHHLAARRGYIFEPGETADEESLADKYAGGLRHEMLRRWPYQLGRRCIKELAFWHYCQGILDARGKQYRSAADHFYKAWDLDPTLENVGSYFWFAKRMSEQGLAQEKPC